MRYLLIGKYTGRYKSKHRSQTTVWEFDKENNGRVFYLDPPDPSFSVPGPWSAQIDGFNKSKAFWRKHHYVCYEISREQAFIYLL